VTAARNARRARVNFVDERPDRRDRQEHPQCVRRERGEPIAFVQRRSPCNALRVSAIQHIQHHHREAEIFGGTGDPSQGIDKRVAAKAAG
jgi:hypothetical protein